MAYQSKLFQFIQTQWWQGKVNLGKIWRNVQTQTQWAVQILAYPFYVVTQTTRVIDRQWRKTSYRLFSSNEDLTKPPSPSDVLIKLELNPEVNILACDREGRDLIISDREGQLHPLPQLLTPAQEKSLRYEVASWQRRFKQSLLLQESAEIVPIKTIDDRVVPPVRWFWQMITWMQVSPIATTIDLFGESKTRLAWRGPNPSAIAALPPSVPAASSPHPLLCSLDQTFAQWEQSFPSPPLKKIVDGTWWDEAGFQLFNIPKTTIVNLPEPSPTPSPSNSSSPRSPFESLLESPERPAQTPGLTRPRTPALNRKPFRTLAITPTFSNQGAIEAQQQWQKITMNPRPLEWTVDWDEIEVECTDLGYHRHPLEVILTQVDVLLVKIESWFQSLWQWWHHRHR